jgi:AraC-like DNA-binding protein
MAPRVHRGAMGRVLQRFLRDHRLQDEYSAARLDQLWQQAAAIDPAIGLHLFALFTPADWHVVAHLGQVSASVGDGLQCWQRYARLASDLDQVRTQRQGDRLAVELLVDAPVRLRRFVVEHYAVMLIGLVRQGTGHADLAVHAEFRHPRPAYHALYREVLGQPPRFGAARDCLYLDATCLALPMRQHHPIVAELIREGLERRLARLQQLSGWTARVADCVRAELRQGRPVSLEAAAVALHQSSRTLRRHLEARGLRFRELLDVVRAELEQSLELDGAPRDQIARQLGYRTTATYLQARKRWRPRR